MVVIYVCTYVCLPAHEHCFFLTFFFFSENIDKEDILIVYQEAQKDFF